MEASSSSVSKFGAKKIKLSLTKFQFQFELSLAQLSPSLFFLFFRGKTKSTPSPTNWSWVGFASWSGVWQYLCHGEILRKELWLRWWETFNALLVTIPRVSRCRTQHQQTTLYLLVLSNSTPTCKPNSTSVGLSWSWLCFPMEEGRRNKEEGTRT